MAYGNPTPIGDVRPREPVVLSRDVPHILRFAGAWVTDLDTGQEVFLTGPVDPDRYGLVSMDILEPRTGLPKAIEVLRLQVTEEDYNPVDKPLNLASMKVIQYLAPDLASGAYLQLRYTLIARGDAPKTRYEIHTTAIADVAPGSTVTPSPPTPPAYGVR